MVKPFKFKIIGETYLMMNNPMPYLAESTKSKQTRNVPRKSDFEQEAEKSAYRDKDGNLVFPSCAFKKAMLTVAPRFILKGRKTLKPVMIHVRPISDYVTLTDADGNPLREYEIDIRPARIDKALVVVARPKVKDWFAELTLLADPEVIQPDTGKKLEMVLHEAGQTVGIGAWRLEKGGWYGIFRAEWIGGYGYELVNRANVAERSGAERSRA